MCPMLAEMAETPFGNRGMLRLRIGSRGRTAIPTAARHRLGLKPGDALVAWLEGDRLVLRPHAAVEAALWRLFEGEAGSLTAELIAERREEAAQKDGRD